MQENDRPVALVTGAARRVGASIARRLHTDGFDVAVHYRTSANAAFDLCASLEEQRAGGCAAFSGDLANPETPQTLIQQVITRFGHLKLLVNNASSFYASPIGEITQLDWDDLFGSNARGPLFLSQAAAPYLADRQGAIVNIVDIHGFRPIREHSVYSMAKAAQIMMTRALARDLAPEIRVNGVAPGAVLWPEHDEMTTSAQESLIKRVPLGRIGTPDDIAQAVTFLAGAPYITGQILAVDGGRTLNI